MLDPLVLEEKLMEWVREVFVKKPENVIAIDGKAIRGIQLTSRVNHSFTWSALGHVKTEFPSVNSPSMRKATKLQPCQSFSICSIFGERLSPATLWDAGKSKAPYSSINPKQRAYAVRKEKEPRLMRVRRGFFLRIVSGAVVSAGRVERLGDIFRLAVEQAADHELP